MGNSTVSRYKARRRQVVRPKTASVAPPSPLSVPLEVPPIQLYVQIEFPSSSAQPSSTSPTIEIRQPNAEDKMIADIVRLGVTIVRKYPKESAALGFGFCLAALIDAARNN